MPKYLFEGSYTAEGFRSVAKEKASGRKAAVEKLLSSVGGKLEGIYFALGEMDVFVLVDLPSTESATAVGVAVSASGLLKTRIIPLLTIEETDQALSANVSYR